MKNLMKMRNLETLDKMHEALVGLWDLAYGQVGDTFPEETLEKARDLYQEVEAEYRYRRYVFFGI